MKYIHVFHPYGVALRFKYVPTYLSLVGKAKEMNAQRQRKSLKHKSKFELNYLNKQFRPNV